MPKTDRPFEITCNRCGHKFWSRCIRPTVACSKCCNAIKNPIWDMLPEIIHI